VLSADRHFRDGISVDDVLEIVVEEYHGIIVDVSQKDKIIFRKLNILGKKKVDDWVMYKVEVSFNDLDKVIGELQDNLVDGFYFHFYKGDELIVVFKEKLFKVNIGKSNWSEVIEYGMSLGIPKEQLDFYPCRADDEEY